MRRRRRKRCRRRRHPRPRRTALCWISPTRPSRSSPTPPRSAATSPMIRSTSVLPSEEVNSQEIEGVLADETEVIEPDERRQRNGKDESTEPEMQNEGGEIVELKRPAPAKGKSSELSARTDDPVRMYLREMGSVELLSREGEIAIAKRIEAGREAMIAGLCESPLTFQAIIIWRDELKEGKVFLRDIIDLEATYEGPEAKAAPPPVMPAAAAPPPVEVAPPAAPAPAQSNGAGADGEEGAPR